MSSHVDHIYETETKFHCFNIIVYDILRLTNIFLFINIVVLCIVWWTCTSHLPICFGLDILSLEQKSVGRREVKLVEKWVLWREVSFCKLTVLSSYFINLSSTNLSLVL